MESQKLEMESQKATQMETQKTRMENKMAQMESEKAEMENKMASIQNQRIIENKKLKNFEKRLKILSRLVHIGRGGRRIRKRRKSKIKQNISDEEPKDDNE